MTNGLLLVDDDAFTAKMTALQLEKEGYQAEIASSGAEALALLDQGTYSMVLTDMVMPEMNGTELTAAIRARPDGQMPILVLSALGNTDQIKTALEAGATDWLPKTREHGLLARKLKLLSVLNQPAPTQEAPSGERASGDGLWNYNLIKAEISFSKRWKALLGYQPDQVGNQAAELITRIHEADRAAFQTALEEHTSRRKPLLEIDLRMRRVDGDYAWVHLFGAALFGKDGKAARLVGSMTLLDRGDHRSRVHAALDRVESRAGNPEQQAAAIAELRALIG